MLQILPVQIALLRGVMPTGRNRTPMAELRRLMEDLGFEGARTYIASGNAMFRSDRPREELEGLLEREIAARIGPMLDVMVRDLDTFEAAMAQNPFPDDAAERPSRVLMTVLKGTPEPAAAQAFEALAVPPDKCRVIGDVAWLVFTDASSLKAYTPAAYRRLGFAGTGRNWNTALKLREIAGEMRRG
jgi:uncharacterized protein (DUF1697 family)